MTNDLDNSEICCPSLNSPKCLITLYLMKTFSNSPVKINQGRDLYAGTMLEYYQTSSCKEKKAIFFIMYISKIGHSLHTGVVREFLPVQTTKAVLR